jgi:glycosyltransferase involved in cell wall biosynthesis
VRVLVTLPWGQRLGGAEAMLDAALMGADREQFELVFLQPGTWADELAASGFAVDVVRAGRLRQVHRWSATVLRLARIIRRRHPDLVLNWSAKTQLYGAPAAALAGMRDRNIWWQHSIPTGAWIDRLATLLPTRAIGCTSQAAARAQARLRPHRRTFVVSAGSPPPAASASPVNLPHPSGVPLVGIVGRLQPSKGQQLMLEAQAMLRGRGHDFHLLIVGGDSYGLSPEYPKQLSAAIERLGLGDAVTMVGEVPDAGPYIEAMDVLVVPSAGESFGIVLVEAMARGVAVMAVNSGGPAELIEHGRTGMLARSGAPSALAEALQPLLVSPQLRAELGRAGRDRYLRDFTHTAMRERFLAALDALLATEE